MATTQMIEFVDVQDLLQQIPGTTLDNATIDLTLVKAQVKAPFNVNAGPDITFVIDAGAELTLTAFNQARSEDPDRILANENATTPSGELVPQVTLDKDHAWLKYRVQAHAGASASVDAGWFAAAAGASASIVTGDYRRHDHDAMALSAIESDVAAAPRFVVSLSDVLAMGPGDAVLLQVGGELTASVSVSWSDIFTSQLATLTRAIRGTAPIGIRTTAGASVQASVKITDQFVLAFSRVDSMRWRVGLKKGTVKQVDFGAEAGITVEIDNPDAITRLLNDFLTDLLGKPFSAVKALLANGSISEDDLEAFADVFRRLGLGSIPTLADLKQALDKLEASVIDRVTTLLKEKISLGFSYQYHRVPTETLLLQATLTQPAVATHHSKLTRGELGGLLASVLLQPPSAGGPIVVEQYLNEKQVTTDKAWGFTLGIGKWSLSGRDRRSTTAIRRISLDELHEQRSYVALGEYTGNVFGEKQTWHVDLPADMPRFSVSPVPRFSEYQFGLNLAWIETNRKFDRSDIDQAADFAAIWAICGPNDTDAVKMLLEPFKDKKGVEWSAHLRINDEACRAVVGTLAASGRTQFAEAMAAAMQGRGSGLQGILDAQRRRTLYEPIWGFYLGEADTPDPSTVSLMAQTQLRTSAADSAFAEQNFRGIDPMVTAAGTCDKNPDTRSNIDDFLRGTRALALAINRNDPDLNVIPQAYGLMAHLWTQSHHVRMLGVRILDVARQMNQLKGIERTLTITADGRSLTVSANPSGTI